MKRTVMQNLKISNTCDLDFFAWHMDLNKLFLRILNSKQHPHVNSSVVSSGFSRIVLNNIVKSINSAPHLHASNPLNQHPNWTQTNDNKQEVVAFKTNPADHYL